MTPRRAWLVLALGSVSIVAQARAESPAARTDATETSAARTARARELFDEGRTAYEAGKLTTALACWTEAHTLAPDYRSAAVLGQLQLELGEHVSAATRLDESLRLFPRGRDPEGFHRVLNGLSEARQHVGTLRVQSPTPGAELWLDGRRLGPLPLASDLFVAPGRHRLELMAPGYERRVAERHIPAGGVEEVTLTLDAIPMDDGAETQASGALLRATLLAGGALTLVGVSTGVAFEWWARDAHDQVESLRATAGDCTGNTVLPRCAELHEHSDAAASRHDTASVAFVSAAILGVATVGVSLWLHADAEPRAGTAWTLTPWLGPDVTGVGVEGGF